MRYMVLWGKDGILKHNFECGVTDPNFYRLLWFGNGMEFWHAGSMDLELWSAESDGGSKVFSGTVHCKFELIFCVQGSN